MFAMSPARDYFGITDHYMIIAFDLTCMTVFMEHENHYYEQGQKNAQHEAGAIGQYMQEVKDRMSDR